MGTLRIFITLLILNCSFSIATIRYVSHSGSNTPPYLTWETAADSIMSAINISSFGDTIYVANGVYEEKVVMIPGLSLIGAGSDSCIVSFQELNIAAVSVEEDCLLKGFQIIVPDTLNSLAIEVTGNNSLITNNNIVNAARGIYLNDVNTIVYGNIFNNIISAGIEIHNSNSIIRKNTISIGHPIPYAGAAGIYADVFDYNDTPIIDSNIIYTDREIGIFKSGRAKAIIANNTLLTFPATGIYIGNCDSVKVFNNLIKVGLAGIANLAGQFTQIYNNYIYGLVIRGMTGNSDDSVKNNVITNAQIGIEKETGQNAPIVKYNDLWKIDSVYAGFTGDTTNMMVDPMIVNDDEILADPDFHLQKYSPLIDAGDPSILDKDGSRSDIGLYGGPYGEVYTYNDLAPRPPHNVTAIIEQGLVKLTWNRNTEADFSHYRIYRDTVSNFICDTTKIIGETTDTVYYDDLPAFNGEKNFYYLLTAFDNQGNQSYPSEEVMVQVTGLAEHPPIGSDGYRLLSNYPNPFNPSTIIPYRLKEGGYVKLYIYDIKGELVTTLVNQWQNKGYYEVVFRPTADERQRAAGMEVPIGPTYSDMASGVYLYMIMVSNERNIPVFSDMGKMILLK